MRVLWSIAWTMAVTIGFAILAKKYFLVELPIITQILLFMGGWLLLFMVASVIPERN